MRRHPSSERPRPWYAVQFVALSQNSLDPLLYSDEEEEEEGLKGFGLFVGGTHFWRLGGGGSSASASLGKVWSADTARGGRGNREEVPEERKRRRRGNREEEERKQGGRGEEERIDNTKRNQTEDKRRDERKGHF
ncbi:hypothetical protein CesoFtcFv8_021600 [Champsocephalus esox]|uniref:Uncharacterized protein n=1 Tax=Champsocephalus esox TaxID=159716 RepID=A0AAN8B8T6_9TELE|nr:hypothetical protein CesoFtcFv8_021600 [Champsocephalus esox]